MSEGTAGSAPALPTVKVPTRRNLELALLVLAFAIGAWAYANVGESVEQRLPLRFTEVLALVGVLVLVAHLAVRFLAPHADPFILPAATALNLVGLAMIYRIDLAEAARAERNGDPIPSPDSLAQLTWLTISIALFVGVLLIVRDHRKLQRYTYTMLVVGVVLLLLPLVPGLGATINGARLWIQFAGLSFQPSEFAKIALAIFFSGYLVRTRDSLALVRTRFAGVGLPRGRDVGPLIVAWLIALGILAFERDLGTALMFFGMFVVLLYVATGRKSWLIIGGLLFITAALLGYLAFGHVRVRVQVWLDVWSVAQDEGYQLAQSLFGLANGGILGTGMGNGFPHFVPFAKSDFIAAALGEELGLTGMMALLLLYAIIIERGLRTAVAVRDPFGQLLAVALATVLALQVFVVIGGVTRLIPLTGLTTPFLSYGGSALLANWVMVALLLRISDRARSHAGVLTTAVQDSVVPAPAGVTR